MGTSSSRTGQNAPSGPEWRRARTEVTRYIKRTGAPVTKPLSYFVRALGGAGGAVKTGAPGTRGELNPAIKTGQNLGALLYGIRNEGLDKTLFKFGLTDLIGSEPVKVLYGIIDVIAGEGKTVDSSIARAAAVEVVATIFDEENDDYGVLKDEWESNLDEIKINGLLSLFIAQVIFQVFLSHFAERINTNLANQEQNEYKEREIFEFIQGNVELEFGETDPLSFDWQGAPGEELIKRHIQYALEQLEG